MCVCIDIKIESKLHSCFWRINLRHNIKILRLHRCKPLF